MLFNSYPFLFVFFPVCLLGFYLLYRRAGELWVYWLTACSLAFYGYWNISYLPILLGSIAFNYALAFYLQKGNKPLLVLGVAANLATLFYFKYFNFFLDTVGAAEGTWPEIVLPIGISFFTFQQIAFLVDANASRAPRPSLVKYAFFVSFFPQLIAGPIVHHREIIAQYDNYREHGRDFSIGISIFSIGLFKKVLIADTIAPTAQAVFTYANSGATLSFLEAWYGALAYSLQIYFDFSAYSDMAIGLGMFFGIRLPQNFSSPYKATSIADFWRRWHITLSRFLKEYLYFPLGGNRLGPFRHRLNLLVTMVLGGIWHGASFNFLVWGGLHGLFLLVQSLFGGFSWRLPRPVAWGLTLLCVVFAWIPFRAADLPTTLSVWASMLGMNGLAWPEALAGLGLPVSGMLPDVNVANGVWIVILLFACVTLPNTCEIFRGDEASLSVEGYPSTYDRSRSVTWTPTSRWAIVVIVLLWFSLLKINDPSEFLYFQF